MTGSRYWRPGDARAALEAAPDRPSMLVVEGEAVHTVTAGALIALVNGAAHLMRAHGVGRGDVVALWADNSPRWIAAGLAAAEMGAVLAPLDATLPADTARAQVARSGASLVLTGAGDGLGAEVPARPLSEIAQADAPPPADEPGPDAPIALFRTSGTTGRPKSFHLSRANIGAGVTAMLDWRGVTGDDRVLMPLPLHHVYPWVTATLPALTLGAPLVLPESPTGPHIVTALRLTRPSVLIGVPRLFQALLDGVRSRAHRAGRLAGWAFEALLATAIRLRRATGGRIGAQLLAPVRRRVAPGLRLMVSGGAHLRPELEEALEAFGWDMRSGYGLSETAAAFSATFGPTPPGSVGRPILDGEVRIEAPDAHGIGQILVRGPTVFSGYLDAPEEARDAFDADGFFRTGDLGWVDGDGHLHVTGRKKETIVLPGGDTLNPEDVEAEYLADPQIREIGVFERDGVLRGVVVPDTAEIAGRGITDPGEAVRVAVATIGRGLPSTWRLSGVVVTREPLPRTRLGKIRRFLLPDLHDRAAQGGGIEPRELTQEERAWVETPPRAAAWEILTREAGDRSFDLDSHLQLDLGIDSFGWMTLAVALEEEAGVRLSTADMAAIGTVRDYLEAVTRKAEAPQDGAGLHAGELARARRWLAPRSRAERLAGRLVHALVGGLVRLLFRLKVTGAERLPAEGAILICPNHASDLDPAVLAAALPRAVRARAAWAGVRRRVFGSAALRALARPLRVFPVDERMPMVAVDIAVEALGEGAAQVWFPEGWRSPDGTLLPFQPGIGHVVERAGCPVVPVHIAGTLEAWPRDRRWPRPGAVSVSFGAPVAAADLLADAPAGKDRARAVASALRARVAELARSRGAEIG